jgi:murein DD-endopeptidase MepM/ murein hydrolase activator NlpD
MESMLLKQIVTSSGAFKGGEGAGSAFRSDIFAQTLSDALAQGGGIGLAKMLERSLGGGAPAPAAPSATVASLSPLPPRSPVGQIGATLPDRARTDLPVELSSPLPGARTSSPFGVRKDPISGVRAGHDGLDLAASGGAPVEASAPGVVISAGPRGAYGLAVEIDHGHGITTLYGHASQVLVQPGERVQRGDQVALLGDTGRSTGPHLHFEVRSHGRPVDPRQALNAYRSGVDNPLGSEALAPARSP